MSNVDEQFKRLDKKAEKLQRESEKNSEYNPIAKSKQFLRLLLFLVSISILSISMFFMLESLIKTSFKDLFVVSSMPSIAVPIFFAIGIFMLFFMKRKVYGTAVTVLSLLILVLMIAFFIELRLIKQNVFLYFSGVILIFISVFVLIKAYRIKKSK